MKKIILVIFFLTAIAAFVLWFLHLNPLLGLFGGTFAIIMVYATWTQPSKHKNFSLADQQKATSRALGGSGPIEVPEPNLVSSEQQDEK